MIDGWLKEMGKEAMSEEAFAGLPDQILMGSQGKWLEVEKEGEKLVGIVAQLNSEGHEPMTILATLCGPTAIVDGEKIMLRTFAESLRIGALGGGAGAPH